MNNLEIMDMENDSIRQTAHASVCTQADSKRILMGWGACSATEYGAKCPCQAYAGGGDNCTNCGHKYGDHW
jgi:hypothetical protein